MPASLTWPPTVQWNTPAGEALGTLVANAPADPSYNRLIIFGSGALQMTVLPELLSADIDISLDIVQPSAQPVSPVAAEEVLRRAATITNEQSGSAQPLVQVCHWMTFQPAARWERRIHQEQKDGWQIVFPHPFDILFAKLRRLEPKDLEAFERLTAATGRPSESEFLALCLESYRDFVPRLEGEVPHLPSPVPRGDLRKNVARLWPAVWRRSINIDREIVEAAEKTLEMNWYNYPPELKN
ncbi:MAG: hypothetical protein JO271_12505, partial [Verrucomicrobia bacterium]|nr:hypothetical protein [Verrucomicrobiota bacterium]